MIAWIHWMIVKVRCLFWRKREINLTFEDGSKLQGVAMTRVAWDGSLVVKCGDHNLVIREGA